MGTTIHVVDSGIDTGKVLAQARFAPTAADSFVTYPFLHLVYGLPILGREVEALLAGNSAPIDEPGDSDETPSQLRWHPTLWGYLGQRIRRGVR